MPEGGLRVHTRNGYDYTDEFMLPVKGLAAPGTPMVLDGEIAVPNQEGLTHLDWLHDARTHPICRSSWQGKQRDPPLASPGRSRQCSNL